MVALARALCKMVLVTGPLHDLLVTPARDFSQLYRAWELPAPYRAHNRQFVNSEKFGNLVRIKELHGTPVGRVEVPKRYQRDILRIS